jgi:hypothetical protein
MTFARLRSGFTSKTTTLALLSALACAGGSWTFNAGSALAPEPADLKSELAGTFGATAAATIVEEQPSTLLLWPAHWEIGPSIAVGTPCSPYGLGYGTKPTKRIQGRGNLRACLPFDTSVAPPANAVRPLPPMPVTSCAGGGETYTEVTAAIAEAISWPANWVSPDDFDDPPPTPYAGQPCSDFPLLAGETTYKHIQTAHPDCPLTGPFRCVRLNDPILYPGPCP